MIQHAFGFSMLAMFVLMVVGSYELIGGVAAIVAAIIGGPVFVIVEMLRKSRRVASREGDSIREILINQ